MDEPRHYITAEESILIVRLARSMLEATGSSLTPSDRSCLLRLIARMDGSGLTDLFSHVPP
jgi:hypothetical protein